MMLVREHFGENAIIVSTRPMKMALAPVQLRQLIRLRTNSRKSSMTSFHDDPIEVIAEALLNNGVRKISDELISAAEEPQWMILFSRLRERLTGSFPAPMPAAQHKPILSACPLARLSPSQTMSSSSCRNRLRDHN